MQHRGEGVDDLCPVDAEGGESMQSQLGGHVVDPFGPMQVSQQLVSVASSRVEVDQQAEHRHVGGEVGVTVLGVVHRI